MLRKIAVSLTVAASLVGASFQVSAETVKIGVVLPLSGPNAQFGINARTGIEMALEGIKEKGDIDVELVYADVPEPNAAASAVQRLVSRERVVGIVGSFASSITLAASEVTERTETPMITHSFADQITSRGYRYIFQVSPKATTFGQKQFQYAMDVAEKAGEKVDKIAIFYEDTAYGTAQAEGIRQSAKAAGVEVVIDDAYPLGITDVAPLINKLRRSDAQVVYPVSYFNDALLIIRTMRQQKVDMPIVGGAAGYIVPDFQKALGEFADDVFSIAPANYDALPEVAKKYHEQHGVFMAHESIMYAAALEHMVEAVRVAGSTDSNKVRDAVASLKKCDGFSAGIPGGCTAFDETGLSSTAYPIFVQWRGDDLLTVYPEEDATAAAHWRGQEVQ